MRNKRVLPALLGSVALTLGLVTVSTSINKEVVNAAEESVTMTSFSETSAGMNNVVSYSTAKGGGTSNPAINGGEIRLYQNSAGTGGGTITITCTEGYTLSSVTIGSSMATSVAYTIGTSSTKSSNQSISAGGKYTVDDINSNKVTFYCMGTTKNSRLYVNYLSATYIVPDSNDPDVDLTNLVNDYVEDGTYTKTTTINLDKNPNDKNAQEELAILGFDNLFHASESTLKRTTYYNDDALLMANYDGSLKGVNGCTSGINSGYGTVNSRNIKSVQEINKNAEIGDLTHFTFNGETQIYDYIVKQGQHKNWSDPNVDGMEGFYVTPKDFAAEEYFQGWQFDENDNSYFLNVKNSDKIVNDFVNVVAPLLLDTVLTSNYISVTSLKIHETDAGLSMQIIAANDYAKFENNTTILAEAIITKDCNFDFSYALPALSNATFEFASLTDKGTELSKQSALNIFRNSLGENADALSDISVVSVYSGNASGGAFPYTTGLLKFGTGSVAGKITLTFDKGSQFTTARIKCHCWSDSEVGKIKVNNGTYQSLPKTHTKDAELVFNFDPTNEIVIEFEKRGYIFEIVVE